MERIKVEVNSEIGELEAVILHAPGPEVENMTPENAQRALYSDILNLSEVKKEYTQFKKILEKHTTVFFVKDHLCCESRGQKSAKLPSVSRTLNLCQQSLQV